MLVNNSHNFFSFPTWGSLSLFAFDFLHTTWSHLSPGLTLCPKTRLTCQIPCSAQMSLLFNMCLLPVPYLPVFLSACLRVFRLTPFVFWYAFFYFQHFTWYTNLPEQQKETEENCWSTKIKPKKFAQLTSRCASKRSWPLVLGRSIRPQSAVSTEIKA